MKERKHLKKVGIGSDKIKMDIKEIKFDKVDWIHQILDG
jgi:hypothetical protein